MSFRFYDRHDAAIMAIEGCFSGRMTFGVRVLLDKGGAILGFMDKMGEIRKLIDRVAEKSKKRHWKRHRGFDPLAA